MFKKDIDKSQLQTFMSNKVQSLLSSSPGKESLTNSKIENDSLSAFNLRKNIALSMQKSELSPETKPRRGRKPINKNQNNIDSSSKNSIKNSVEENGDTVADKSSVPAKASKLHLNESILKTKKNINTVEDTAQTSMSNLSSDTNETSYKESKSEKLPLLPEREVSKVPAKRGRPPLNKRTLDTNETNSKERKLLEKLSISPEREVPKVPAKRGRPPKKLEDKLKEAAVVSKIIQSKISVSKKVNLQTENKDEITSKVETGEHQIKFC